MPGICHELIIGASSAKVYNALTKQEELAQWWTPHTNAVAEVNSISRFSFGENYFKEMKIIELIPLEKVKWICTEATAEWIGTTISFDLRNGYKEEMLKSNSELADQIYQQKSEQATILMFHHDHWKSYSPMFAECNYSWGRFLGSLKLFCETGKGNP